MLKLVTHLVVDPDIEMMLSNPQHRCSGNVSPMVPACGKTGTKCLPFLLSFNLITSLTFCHFAPFLSHNLIIASFSHSGLYLSEVGYDEEGKCVAAAFFSFSLK